MKPGAFLIVTAFLLSLEASAQTITGTFPLLAGQGVRLEGFYGFDTYLISSTAVSEDGKFVLNYSEAGCGMGQIVSADNRPFIVILSGEDIKLKGESFDHPETIEILKAKENRLFEQYATDEQKFNENTDYLFKLLERRSLLGSSEYLALKVLSEVSCTIDNDLAAQLESYRAMKPGNTAPDFAFRGDVFATPTLYLLDSKREILLRPNSVRHMDAWVDWYLVQGKR